MDFFFAAAKEANVNLSGILHGGQELIFHRPIPASGTFTTTGCITHVYDKKEKGAIIIAESDTHYDTAASLHTALFLADLAESDGICRQPENAYRREIETVAADHYY